MPDETPDFDPATGEVLDTPTDDANRKTFVSFLSSRGRAGCTPS